MNDSPNRIDLESKLAFLERTVEELSGVLHHEAIARQALEARLAGREGSTPELVARRMEDARREIMHWRRYDYVIVNDELKAAYQRLKRILLVERLKRLRQLDLEDHVRTLLGDG